jgi:Zn-dependent protease
MLTLFYFIVFIFSVVIHEVSHGYVAKALGDDTAEQAGRLTLNPLSHLDLFGSVILPFLLYLASLRTGVGIIFGWARPVPYNPFNLKDPKRGSFLIALAGPSANFLIAFIFGLFIRFGLFYITPIIPDLFRLVVYTNIILGVFNLMPIPPLDGSKVLFGVLPSSWHKLEEFLIRNSLLIFLLFLFWGLGIVSVLVGWLFRIFTGVSPGF